MRTTHVLQGQSVVTIHEKLLVILSLGVASYLVWTWAKLGFFFFFLLELLLISTMTQNFEIYPHNHGQLINRQTEQITFSLWTKHKHDYINTKWRRWGIEKPSPVGAKVTTHHCDSVHLVNKSLCLSSVDTVETRIVQKWLMMMMAYMWKYTLSSVWKCLCLSAKQKV